MFFMQHYIEKLILGYVHLLVNTRSEIGLARVINVPNRGIDQKAFTDIKHMAQTKQLSMYQVCFHNSSTKYHVCWLK